MLFPFLAKIDTIKQVFIYKTLEQASLRKKVKQVKSLYIVV